MSTFRFASAWLITCFACGLACTALRLGAADPAYRGSIVAASGAAVVLLVSSLPTMIVCMMSCRTFRGLLLLTINVIGNVALAGSGASLLTWAVANTGYPAAVRILTTPPSRDRSDT